MSFEASVAKSIASKTGDRSPVLRAHVRRRALTPPGCPLVFLSAMARGHACRHVCACGLMHTHTNKHIGKEEREGKEERSAIFKRMTFSQKDFYDFKAGWNMAVENASP